MIILKSFSSRPNLKWPALVAPALLAASAATHAADATGVLADRNETLQSLDAQYINDPSTGVHFVGSRVTSVLDAGVSTYSSATSTYRYWATRPGVPKILVGSGLQSVSEQEGNASGLVQETTYPVPLAGGGVVGVSVGYNANSHAAAQLSTGTLRNSADNTLVGPTVTALPAPPYDGFGAYGTAFSRSEVADYLTASSAATLRLTGAWDGSLQAGDRPNGVTVLNSPNVFAQNPLAATAHVEISVWSAPKAVLHPGDEESPAVLTYERTYLGGIAFEENVPFGNAAPNIHHTFDLSIPVPAGDLYFYAAQWVITGGQTDATKGLGGSVYTDSFATANFDHTLSFDLVPSVGTLSSESGEFLSSVPEPGGCTLIASISLCLWGAFLRIRRSPTSR